jgi:RNA polymerase sigma factor (sigma-70 family)
MLGYGVRIPGRGDSAGFFIVPDAERVWYNFRTTGVSVNPDDESKVEGIAWFRTTQWTMVMLAAKRKTPAGQAALAELYEIYWLPLYAFARRRGRSPHDAQDLTQGFFLSLMERETLSQVDQLKGKFRSFLLASFQNYLSVEAQRARCLKRGGAAEFVSLDINDAEDRYLAEQIEYLTPDKHFDAQWAMTLLRQAMTRLREEYIKHGKASAFDALKGFVNEDESKDSLSCEQVAKLPGVRVGSAKTLIHRFRKRYSTFVRQEKPVRFPTLAKLTRKFTRFARH